MNKPYIFMDESFNDLNSLAMSYIKHFDEGMNDIYANTKALIKFIKSRINNKNTIKKYVEILSETKYKSNALTFMIFEMTDHKEIIIGGVRLDLLSYLQALRENPDPANNILFGFLEDGGITKTYKVQGVEPKLCNHSEAIERNYRNPFTYAYLTAYYGYQSTESLDGKLRNIAINGEECFRRFSKFASQESFLLSLAHKAGFTETIEAVKDDNPAFKALKLLKKETEEEYLRKIVDGSYFWWMLNDDNYNKYDYKPKALKILKKYNDIKKDYDHYMELIKQKKISSISFDNYIDISNELYNNYLCFVWAYHNDLIEVKKKYDPENYAPDKAYNKTYICVSYMQGKVVKLYSPDTEKTTRINPLTGAVITEYDTVDAIDDVTADKPDLILPTEKKEAVDINKKKKRLKGQESYAKLALIFGTIGLVPALAIVLITKFLNTGALASLAANYSLIMNGYTLYIAFGAYLLVFLTSLLTLIGVRKTGYQINQYDKLVNHTEVKDFLEEEKILYQEDLKKLEKKVNKGYAFITFITNVFLGVICAFVSIVLFGTLSLYLPVLGTFADLIKDLGAYIVLAFGGLLGMILGMINHKKNTVLGIIFIVVVIITSFCILLVL